MVAVPPGGHSHCKPPLLTAPLPPQVTSLNAVITGEDTTRRARAVLLLAEARERGCNNLFAARVTYELFWPSVCRAAGHPCGGANSHSEPTGTQVLSVRLPEECAVPARAEALCGFFASKLSDWRVPGTKKNHLRSPRLHTPSPRPRDLRQQRLALHQLPAQARAAGCPHGYPRPPPRTPRGRHLPGPSRHGRPRRSGRPLRHHARAVAGRGQPDPVD